MSKYLEEQDEQTFSEPILAQKNVRCGISFAAHTQWKVQAKKDWTPEQAAQMQSYIGQKFDALILTLMISDDTVKTERADAKPKLTIEDQLNLEGFPYPERNTGQVKKMSRQKLFQLEGIFGFEPIFKVDGEIVPAYVTKTGNKVAPKVEGKVVQRILNPDFFNAYFLVDANSFGEEQAMPRVEEWVGKTIYADIEVQRSEKFGDRNAIARYVKAPAK